MKAVSIQKNGKINELVYQTVLDPILQKGEALIQVVACAVNHLDLHILKGRMNIPLPHIPGSDVAGIIKEIQGETNLGKGQEVIINPAIRCKVCRGCQRNLTCENINIFGYKTSGGYADYISVPIEQIYPKPKNLSFIEAASFPLTYLTAWHMLSSRANVQQGERIFIWGASGGLGSAGVQIAKYLGAQVIAATNSQENVKKIQEIGADHVIIYQKDNVVEKVNHLTNGENIDVVFESVGEKTWDTSLSLLRPYGRLVIAGTTTGSDVKLNLKNLYRHQYAILGASMGTKEEFEEVLKLFSNGSLRPIIDKVFPLEKAAAALRRMEESKQMGKIVLEI
jgi:NADPH:quinone reductase-like Zn-dependent oxidoreductase